MNPVFTSLLAVTSLVFVTAAYGQEKKSSSHTLIIRGGDTIINGKSLADVDRAEADRLRREVKDLEKKFKPDHFFDNRGLRRPEGVDRDSTKTGRYFFNYDTAGRSLNLYNDRSDSSGNNPGGFFRFRGNSFVPGILMFPDSVMIAGIPGRFPERRVLAEPSGRGRINNSMSFSFYSVDKEGIPTRVNISVREASAEKIKKAGTEGTEQTLKVEDLVLFPKLSTGETILTFNISETGPVQIRITDSGDQHIFADKLAKFNGSYMKAVPLIKNGLYYLYIRQGKKWYIKQLIKE